MDAREAVTVVIQAANDTQHKLEHPRNTVNPDEEYEVPVDPMDNLWCEACQ